VRCPRCQHQSDRVLDSRPTPQGDAIRRRRECDACHYRYTSYERIELQLPMVVKKDGARQAFSREKLVSGMFKALHRRPILPDLIYDFAKQLEVKMADGGEREVESSQIGEQVMQFLRCHDPIAYVRFASVYKEFRDVQELLDEVRALAAETQP